MNYYGAREMADENGNALGTFRFTVRNDNRINTYGACRDNCPGHATKAEACNHFRDGELKVVEFKPMPEWPKHKCERHGCDKQATVKVGPAYLMLEQPMLCEKHATKEVVREIWGDGEFTCMSS